MSAAVAVQVGVAFTWLGMVLAISFLETPLKFRAPGMTVELGVGIGRLVFRALNLVEAALAIALVVTAALSWSSASWGRPALIVALVVVLVIQAAVLRPLMDARVRRGRMADGQPRHRLHIGYVALEGAKALLLLGLGIAGLVA